MLPPTHIRSTYQETSYVKGYERLVMVMVLMTMKICILARYINKADTKKISS